MAIFKSMEWVVAAYLPTRVNPVGVNNRETTKLDSY